jgi:hypothetical protein
MRRVTSSMKLGFSLPVAFHPSDTPQGPNRRPLFGSLDEIRDDIRRYAELGLTELFLEANVLLHAWPVDRTLEIMAALAPARSLDAS